jgi:nucleoside-triphosphatase THEP1
MELTSPEFKRGAEACFKSGKPILAVVHDKIKDPLIEEIKGLADKEMLEVTLHNREGLPASLSSQILAILPPQTV